MTGAERQKVFKEKMRAKGYCQVTVWLPKGMVRALKAEVKERKKVEPQWTLSRLIETLLLKGMNNGRA